MAKTLVLCFIFSALFGAVIASGFTEEDRLIEPTQLEKFVDELPDMPRIQGFEAVNGLLKPKLLNIGMFMKKWVSANSFFFRFLVRFGTILCCFRRFQGDKF